jgi:hypothetical protein
MMVLGLEVAVHRGERHSRPFGDDPHVHGVVAALGTQLDRHLDDALPPGQGLRAER